MFRPKSAYGRLFKPSGYVVLNVPVMEEDEQPELHCVRWQALMVRPESVIALIRSSDGVFHSEIPTFPPDVHLLEAGWDERRGCFVLVLESEFFEECTAMSNALGRIDGTWPEYILDIAEQPVGEAADSVPLEPLPDIGDPQQPVPWEAYVFAAEDLVRLVMRPRGYKVETDIMLPPDARIVWGFHEHERNVFGLVLSSSFHKKVQPQRINGETTIPIAERSLTFRVVQPGLDEIDLP
jgi:hypothetical protein